MDKYKFKATNIIAKTFEEKDINFDVENDNDSEVVIVAFSEESEPDICINVFIGPRDTNRIEMYCWAAAEIPKEKRSRALEACNIANNKSYHMKFYFSSERDEIRVSYDISEETSDESLGEAVFTAVEHMVQEVDKSWDIFDKALYTDEDLEPYYNNEAKNDDEDNKDTLETDPVPAEESGE